jgi:transcriptional regulator with XRE-family HTH domain
MSSKSRGPVDGDRLMGQRLRALRLQSGMSQDELAKEVDISFQQVQKYEKGTNRLAVSRMLQFCDILKTTPNDIIGWKERPSAVNKLDSVLFDLASEFEQLPEELQIVLRKITKTLMPLIKKKR